MIQRIKILIAEDDPGELRLLRISMDMAGLLPCIKKTIAYNGEEAIDAIDQSNEKICFDLLLLDLNMPKVNGRQVLEHINKKRIELRLIIILSNSDSKRDVDDCFQLGAHAYLVKPSNLDHLIAFCGALKTCLETQGSLSLDYLSAQCNYLKIAPQQPEAEAN